MISITVRFDIDENVPRFDGREWRHVSDAEVCQALMADLADEFADDDGLAITLIDVERA